MDRVTRSLLDHYERRIGAAVRPLPGLAGDLLHSSVLECVAQRLRLLVPRVFVVEFHRARAGWGLPVDPASRTAMTRYLEGFGSHTVAGWLERYPVFAELLDGVVDASVSHVGEVAARWVADREDITAVGIGDGRRAVTRIAHLGSDAHQGGRMVAAVHLDDGSRVVYKPRSLGSEEYTRWCLEALSDDVGLDLAPCAPLSLDRGHYGWQREVVAQPAATDGEVRDHHVRLGAACALLTAIGATDLHHENVVAAGGHPVVVDLETALHASVALTAQDLSTAIVHRLKLSPANTLLLPQRLPSGPYSVLLGGIGVRYEQRSSRTDRVLVHRDTDAIDLASRTYPFAHRDNVLHGPDGPVDVLDHVGSLRTGLRRGVAAVAARREDLVRRLDERPVQVRHIVRSTAVYGRVLDAATHPDNLTRKGDFERIVGMLKAPAGVDRRYVQSFVLDAEREALRRADVPYFTVRSDEVRLFCGGARSAPAADLSPRDRAAHGLRRTGPQTLPFDELLLEEGLAEVRTVRRQHQPDYTPAPAGSWGEPFLTADGVDALAVLDALVDVSVVVDGVDGVERGWVPGAFAETLATFDPGTSVSFHDGGGILVPFERAARAGCDLAAGAPAVAAQARRGLRGLVRVYRERLEGLPWSVASGLLSVGYVLGHDARSLDLPATAAPDSGAGPNGGTSTDTMKGTPGAAALLATFPDTDPEVLRRLRPAAGDRAPRPEPLDLAHGPLGLLWARHRAATALGDGAEHADAEGRLAVLARSREAAPRGWCHGHAALVLAAAESEVPDAELRWHAERAAALPVPGEPVDLSVCHGAAGVVQSLLHLAAVRDETWPVDLAADHWQRVAKHARDEGYLTGDPARQGLLGYFLGWSGIADTGLLLSAAREGRPSWVPVAFTASRGLDRGGAR